MASRRRGNVAIVSIVLVTLLIAAFVGVKFITRAGSSSPSTTSGSSAQQNTFPHGAPPWLLTRLPHYAGQALHWRQTSYLDGPDIQDPSKGKEILGDIWVKLDATGAPDTFIARYTLPDGSFYQEIYESYQANIVILGPAFKTQADHLPSPLATPQPWCVQQVHGSPADLAGDLPAFVSESKLAEKGFRMTTGSPAHSGPLTPPLPDVSLATSLSNTSSVRIWTNDETTARGVDHIRIEVDGSGRVTVNEDKVMSAQGQVVSDIWTAYGSPLVYPAASIPTFVFALPNTSVAACL
jgi:hypothetical protein